MASELFDKNYALYRREVAERRVVLRSLPPHVGVVLTTRCHLRCIMCKRIKVPADLPRDIADHLRPLYPYLRGIQWQGGEAFLFRGFKEMLVEAGGFSNIEQHINTSGTLIDEEWAELFVQHGVRLALSIDSVVPATYEAIRRGANWSGLVAGLERLRRAEERHGRRLWRSLNATIMNENFREIELFLPFAIEHGFSCLDFNARLPLEDPDHFLNAQDFQGREALLKLKVSLREIGERARQAGLSFSDRLSHTIAARRAAPRPPTEPPSSPPSWDCLMPWQGLFINAELGPGNIYPECTCITTPIGHISKMSLVEAWNGPAMQEYRRRILARRVHGWCNPICSSGQVDPIKLLQYPDIAEWRTRRTA